MVTKGKNSSEKIIFSTLKKSQKPICCIDSRLDSDAISSALVAESIFKRVFHKKLTLTFPGKLTQNIHNIYHGVNDLSTIRDNCDPTNIIITDYDLLIILDCGEIAHLSNKEEFSVPSTIKSINIDHHNDSNTLFSDTNYVHKAPSTCSLIYKILAANKIQPTKNEAELLLLGILEDSGIFQFDKIDYHDLLTTADLLKITKKGLFHYTHKLTYNEPPDEIMVKKILLEHYTLDLKNKVAYSYGLIKDYQKYNIPDGHKISYSPADYIRKTDGINFAFFVKEKSNGSYSVSLRSRLPDYNVSEIAGEFNGGGHIMSSGMRLDNMKSVDEVIKTVIRVSKKYNLKYYKQHK